jgi:hypothetical protein
MRLVIAAAIAAMSVGACASDGGAAQPAYVVVEENASISDRRLIRRMSILEDDTILIEAGPGDFYQVRLIGPCASIADLTSPVAIEETGIGIDRSSRFLIGGRTCHVRSISRVERTPRAVG